MSTSRKAAAGSLAKACEDVAGNLGTIANTGDPSDAEQRQADYLRDLDFPRHLRDMAERQRREEALRRQREERERWEAEQAAAAEAPAQPEEPEPAERAQAPSEAPADAGEAPEPVLVFEVEVPRHVFPRFKDAMLALGVHGRKVR